MSIVTGQSVAADGELAQPFPKIMVSKQGLPWMRDT